MNQTVSTTLADLTSEDPKRQDSAFQSLMKATSEPVDWAYDVWNDLISLLNKGDNRQRAIASQVLSEGRWMTTKSGDWRAAIFRAGNSGPHRDAEEIGLPLGNGMGRPGPTGRSTSP